MENHETRVMRSKLERVNHPTYYNNGPYIILTKDCKAGEKIPIECIDVIRDMPAWKGNSIKYLWREGDKAEEGITQLEKEIEDLEKSIWYIQNKIDSLKALNCEI